MSETPVKPAAGRRRIIAWASVVLAIAAWAALILTNGYVALGVALAAAVAGFVSMPGSKTAYKRLAVTAIIASLVLIVVVAAYLIVLHVAFS
ncbi:MAG: hypothetical protein J6J93_03075 [Muribaculaceae bacterium]|nr:hypothetical protein [Muribaculaceae bacterium]